MKTDRLVQTQDTFPPPDTLILVVGDVLAAGIATRFARDAETVRLLTDDESAINRAGEKVEVIEGDPAEPRTLRAALHEDAVLIVANGDDGRNLLISRIGVVETAIDAFVVVRDPENVDPFRDAGVHPVCVTKTITSQLEEAFAEAADEDR
jgi:Trk K+ transport system NAD-binding subunit